MDNLGRVVNSIMAIFLWLLALFALLPGTKPELGLSVWIIVSTICLVGGCIVFSRQCVGK